MFAGRRVLAGDVLTRSPGRTSGSFSMKRRRGRLLPWPTSRAWLRERGNQTPISVPGAVSSFTLDVAGVTLASLVDEFDSLERPAFLTRLKHLGVQGLVDRQKLANALGKAKRAGTLNPTDERQPGQQAQHPAPPSEPAVAPQAAPLWRAQVIEERVEVRCNRHLAFIGRQLACVDTGIKGGGDAMLLIDVGHVRFRP